MRSVPSNDPTDPAVTDTPQTPPRLQRRTVLGGTAGAAAITTFSGAAPAFANSDAAGARRGRGSGAVRPRPRRRAAYKVRVDAARRQSELRQPTHSTNGDEHRYKSRFASFTKALPHRDNGEVDPAAFAALVKACNSGKPADFEAIPLGADRKLVNPQAGYAFALEGPDAWSLSTPPAPAFASEEQAAEEAELYWAALARDIPFAQYGQEPITQAAIADLNRFELFRGVDAQSLFRMHNTSSAGILSGPYISQFLTLEVPFGSTTVPQQYTVEAAGVDHMLQWDEWLAVQNGEVPGEVEHDDTKRYLRNGRDLSTWVHTDYLYQASQQAALILLSYGSDALDPNNPYVSYQKQSSNGTFGGSDLLMQIGKVANLAQRAAYFQKWPLHRRLRPEAFGGRVEAHLTGKAEYPIHEKLLSSEVLERVKDATGSYLLPMAYPEGSPVHPAYPSAHATIEGACVTLLKAYFKEDFVIPEPMVATEDGLSLEPYTAGELTIGGELNKLMSNISRGRDIAGVHYLSDDTSGVRLGEALALNHLREQRLLYNEDFDGYTLTTFDGEKITV